MKKNTVNFFFVCEDGRYGVECEACGERFFDRLSKSILRPRLLESGIAIAISHANHVHHSTGGRIGAPAPPPSERKISARAN
jgi:hypothetical protein